jgi:molybdopterin converting factor small subunit
VSLPDSGWLLAAESYVTIGEKMQIVVKLYGDLKRHAPGDRTDFELTLDPGASVGDVLRLLSIPKDHHVSLINGQRATPESRFESGDTLVLFPPVYGG